MTDLSQQLILWLITEAFLSGAVLGILYEAVRLCRLLLYSDGSALRRGMLTVFTFLTDFLFCFFAASVAILLTYNISGGVFRGCLYLSMGAGLLCYRLTLGRILYKVENWAARIIKKVCRFALKVLLFPLKKIFSLLVKIYRLTIGKIIGKIMYRARMKKEKELKEREKECAEALLPESTREEENNADKYERYRKEGRISFGGHRGAWRNEG